MDLCLFVSNDSNRQVRDNSTVTRRFTCIIVIHCVTFYAPTYHATVFIPTMYVLRFKNASNIACNRIKKRYGTLRSNLSLFDNSRGSTVDYLQAVGHNNEEAFRSISTFCIIQVRIKGPIANVAIRSVMIATSCNKNKFY